ncbi:4-hydroxybutyrate CoA-transferase [Dethiosulfatibacter aminovorans DSM 17477]|uniref:4-hydroxybutyrate CoA-transferase n=1 Tax=Dethiosulfatibacter aminovorans DSM 17477 TaxID=1121476 RepID=A0A1M6EN18_9FIRM|nr:acetyl-CoA hydrolase/transferase C-terminal domain-containing protein [Dethiosulfatibacter aminovorans]SHI86937.1 4-hydroxybutyrate CoA-transferase [Dethiosulfatibacter aminovorans DSM 17477]
MNWEKNYMSKLVTADEAVKYIPSNCRVVLGHAVAEPFKLVEAMVKNKKNFENVEIVHMVTLGKGEYTKPEMDGHFRDNTLFVGGSTNEVVNLGCADYTPCFFSEVPKLFREGYMDVDVALLHLSRPGENGYCSYGVSVDYTKPAAEVARIVIAEVNDKMPRTLGDSFIHVSDIDLIVETSYDLVELQLPKIDEIEKSIGENCAKLIEDGDTLQLGIGSIHDAVLMFLKDKKDLGIHSEMISDGVVDLVESGAVNNKKKTLHKNKIVVTFLMGSKKLYDFVDNNEDVEFYPVDYVNDPKVIMQNDNMISINSCIQVDFMGQAVSESTGFKQFSGVGGQVDYVRGAAMANGGKSIIAMPSTASGGKFSRIVPLITEGSALTTSRNDVHYVVTEYGIANLKGKTLKNRAKALIEIAHPDFRDELQKQFEDMF